MTLCNFAPNNWEIDKPHDLIINLTWAFDNVWVSKSVGVLPVGNAITITHNDLPDDIPDDVLLLLSLTVTPLPSHSKALPKTEFIQTKIPVWRSTLGVSTSLNVCASYQGELDAFPSKGTLLTFGPFLQFGEGIQNGLIFLNLEDSPVTRESKLEIYNAANENLIQIVSVSNNKANYIELDRFGFKPNDLPVFICREMAGIPIYMSSTADGTYLSLAYPPSSIFGCAWPALGNSKIFKKSMVCKTHKMIATIIKRLKVAVWTWRQPLTKIPNDLNLPISDLFVWRSSSKWQTYFELIDIPSLFEEVKRPNQVTIVFMNSFGKIVMKKICFLKKIFVKP